MLALFADNLLPVFLAAGAGWLLTARFSVDPRSLSQAAFYVFAPCLVFELLTDSGVNGGALLRMIGFTSLVLLGLATVAGLTARAFGLGRPMIAAIVLTTLLPNAGNFGLSVSLFAFGESGLAQAGVFFVTSAVLSFTVGVLVASLGREGLGAALLGLLRVPALWAVVLAMVLIQFDRTLPLPVDRTVRLLSQASIPVFLVVLGMQLKTAGVRGPWRPVVLGTVLRLGGGVVAGVAVATLVGLSGVARQAGILQAAMPTAIITTVLATEYDVEPGVVTSIVVVSTLLAPLTLTPLLAWIG